MKVLVVDEEASIRLLCRINLLAEGWTVVEATDGPSGLATARTERPDVILLDIMMPGLNGLQVAEALLGERETATIPIIFLTAKAGFADQLRGYEAGGIEYITKPFNPLTLSSIIRHVLDRTATGARPDLDERTARIDKLRVLSRIE